MNTQTILPAIERSIRFSLGRLDVFRCRIWVLAHNKLILIITVLMSMAVPTTSLLTSASQKLSIGFVVFSFIVMTAVTLCILCAFQLVFQFVWLLLNKNRGVLGNHELEIHDDGLVEKTDVNESLYRWSGFHKVSSSTRYLFIFVTDNNVLYVPIRSFPCLENANRFRHEIETRWRTSSRR